MRMDDFSKLVNAADDGWVKSNGVVFTQVSVDKVVAHMVIRPDHLQALGLVHGGIHCALVETLASVGAAVNAIPNGMMVVGLENATSFLKAVRSGKLHGCATPVSKGRRTHVWTVSITDDQGRTAAQGRVRLLCMPADTSVAGQGLNLKAATPTAG